MTLILAILFPLQTVVVHAASDDGRDVLYWAANAVILGAGIGLNRLGWILGERKRAGTALTAARP